MTIPGAVSLTVAGINKFGAVTGFYVDGNGNTDGLLAIPASILTA